MYFFLIFLFISNCLFANQASVENGLIPQDPQRSRDPENIEQRMRDLAVPGVAVAVINNGQIEWEQGYGELKNPDSYIQAASISKTIAALTILSMIEQKNGIDLDSDVSKILDSQLWKAIDPKGLTEKQDHKVTIQRLLSHTAGTTVSGFWGYPRSQDSLPNSDQIILGKGNSPPIIVETYPGTVYAYSGGGTTILQKVIEVLSKKSFSEAVSECVFSKLNMRNSTYYPPEQQVVSGHGADGKLVEGGFHRYPELAAAGLWTRPKDLAQVILAIQKSLAEGGFFSKQLTQTMLTPQTNGHSNGLGVFVNIFPHSTVFHHNGVNVGFQCLMIGNDQGQGAVIMTNSDNGFALQNELLAAIVKDYNWADAELLPQSKPLFESEEIGPVDLDAFAVQFAGTYVYDSKEKHHIVTISYSDKKFTLQVDKEPPFEIIPFGSKIAYYRPHEPGPFYVVRFSTDQGGSSVVNLFDVNHIRKIQ